jgi:hypothetical protein
MSASADDVVDTSFWAVNGSIKAAAELTASLGGKGTVGQGLGRDAEQEEPDRRSLVRRGTALRAISPGGVVRLRMAIAASRRNERPSCQSTRRDPGQTLGNDGSLV